MGKMILTWRSPPFVFRYRLGKREENQDEPSGEEESADKIDPLVHHSVAARIGFLP